MVQWESTGLDIQRSPVQTLVSLYPRVKYLKLSEVKTRSWHGAVLECRTRDPDVPSSNPSVGKKKIPHSSNQNNTTINPSAPEWNTRYFERLKPKVGMVQWLSAGLVIQRSPVQNLLWVKRKSVRDQISTLLPPIPLHQSYLPEIDRCEKQNHCCAVL